MSHPESHWIECSVSGIGQEFHGTLNQAIEQAKQFTRIEFAPVVVYNSCNRLVASVREGKPVWINN